MTAPTDWLKEVATQVPALVLFTWYARSTMSKMSGVVDRNSTVIGRFLEKAEIEEGPKIHSKESR